ncbi:MAG: helix-turn-helix transcriptional regulator [Bacteroidales bacterium]|nr:helix-turn-helix transcriptional regulator [Bacteroidales bacterium]
MKKVKVFIEKSEYGFSAYMDDTPLSYSVLGEGKTVEETIDDFNKSYVGMRDYYERHGKAFEEIEYEFFYDIASFLDEYCKAFSLAGLERITGVSQTQLGHYLHGRSKPSKKTIARIQKGVEAFAHDLTAVRFA